MPRGRSWRKADVRADPHVSEANSGYGCYSISTARAINPDSLRQARTAWSRLRTCGKPLRRAELTAESQRDARWEAFKAIH